MRIQKGHPHFSKRELWNLDTTLAPIIHQALVQFKELPRFGYPMEAVTQYLIDVEGLTEKQVKERFEKNSNDFDSEKVNQFFETILDKIVFAFSKEAKSDYTDIEKCPTDCSLNNPELFEEEIHTTDKKGNRYSSVMFKPKQGYTQEDVDAYWVRYKEYHENLENKVQEGLSLFSKYFYSLWD